MISILGGRIRFLARPENLEFCTALLPPLWRTRFMGIRNDPLIIAFVHALPDKAVKLT